MKLAPLEKELQQEADKERGSFLSGFFKTGKGQYGEGDIFLGISVPQLRFIAAKYIDLALSDIEQLLHAKFHEYRLTAVIILTEKYKKSTESERIKIYSFYIKNARYINNWDLVDASADKIVGAYLFDKSREKLYELAKSSNLWEKRIAIIATYQFIKQKEYKDTVGIAEILLHDKHDLIQKAVGWMLREVGKRVSQEKEEEFLKIHYKTMPRTMLRYAIERFPEEKRKKYLKGSV